MEKWENRSVKNLQEELKYMGVKKTDEEVHKIHFLAERKYNRYDQFLPGETFQHRLIKWLNNFKEDDRQTAMEIIDNLFFFNSHELRALIVSTIWQCINSIQNELLNEKMTKKALHVHLDYKRNRIIESLKKSVFIAVADDVMFDYFRRRAQRRFNDLISDNFIEYYKLHKDSQKEDLNYLNDYERIFLIDQLCGSGTTFIRNQNNQWDGKIVRFFKLWDEAKLKKIYYMPYLMSTVAEKRVNNKLIKWKNENNIIQDFYICPTIKIPISKCLSSNPYGPIDENLPVAKLCKKYYKDCITKNKHIEVGGDAKWGFNNAGLALVLNTNCPNNSIPLLWCSCDNWFPLFPRIEHHR